MRQWMHILEHLFNRHKPTMSNIEDKNSEYTIEPYSTISQAVHHHFFDFYKIYLFNRNMFPIFTMRIGYEIWSSSKENI